MQLAVLSTQMVQISNAVTALDVKLDTLDGKMQRAEGVLAVVRWLGVSGVAIAIVALLRSFGVYI